MAQEKETKGKRAGKRTKSDEPITKMIKTLKSKSITDFVKENANPRRPLSKA